MAILDILNFIVATLENTPEIFFFFQIFIYIMFLLAFGKIAIHGYRNFLPEWMKFSLKLATGTVVLFAGIALSSMFILPGLASGIMEPLRIDLLVFGAISTLILMTGLYLVSKNFPNSRGIRTALQRLEHRIEKAKQKKPHKSNFEPTMAVGALIILATVLFSAIVFQGYPNLSDKIYGEMGTTPDEITGILTTAQNIVGPDDSSMISIAVMANQLLPIFLPVVQILIYIWFSLFIFGWIASLGLVTHYQKSIKFLIRLGSGFLALFVGIALSPFIIISNTHPVQVILEIFQIHILIAGVIASVIIGLGIFLISLNLFSIKGLENDRNSLSKRLKKAQDAEARQKGPPIKRPMFIAGMIIIIAMVALAFYGMGKDPSISDQFDDALSEVGMSREALISLINNYKDQAGQYDEIMEQLGDMPEGCPDMTNIESDIGRIISEAAPITDEGIKEMIEQSSGEEVFSLITTTINGQEVILGVTMTNKACIATRELFCACIDMPEIDPSGFF